MPLPDNPNQISMSQIAAEFGGSVPHQLSEYYDKGNAPGSGEIQMGADFHGTADTDTWRSHYFSSTAQFTVTTAGVCTISMIGGGGAGGFVDTGQYDQYGGGGGAGGVRSGTVTLATGTYQALVGAGASASTGGGNGGGCYIWHYGDSDYAQYTGGTTTGDVRVDGGGTGGDGDGDNGSSSARGSGGGASSTSYSGGSGNTSNISPAVGYSGNNGHSANANSNSRGYTSGAGGGAGEVGGTDDHDEGGDGIDIRIHTGATYKRGGGGGAFNYRTTSYYADDHLPGGDGGGGKGGYWSPWYIYSNNSASNLSGHNGVATTGGGGGGGRCFGNWPGEGQSGNGGSGCIWIAYQIDGDNASSLAFSGTVGNATNTYQA